MATLNGSDISITLSGGVSNSLPDSSLGGPPSVNPILNGRLFQDVSPDQALLGVTDYRCVYLNNTSFDATLYRASLHAEYTTESSATVALGFIEINEKQIITVLGSNNITGGSFSVTYRDYDANTTQVVEWSGSIANWAINLQNALRKIRYLSDVEVIGTSSNGSTGVVFEIEFKGRAGKRYHELIEVENDLIFTGQTTVTVLRIIQGSPVNSEAEEIDVSTTVPNGVDFRAYNEIENSYYISELRPGDILPVWIKRVVPAGSDAVENDGVKINLNGRVISQFTPTPTPGPTPTPTPSPTQI